MNEAIVTVTSESRSPANPPRPRMSDHVATPKLRPIGTANNSSMTTREAPQNCDASLGDAPTTERETVDTQQDHRAEHGGDDTRTVRRLVVASGTTDHTRD